MKSFQIMAHDPSNLAKYSDLKVLKSAAGWYIGTLYNDDFGPSPGSRDSDYFKEKEHAELALQILEYLNKEREGDPDRILDCWEEILDQMDLNPRCVGYRMTP